MQDVTAVFKIRIKRSVGLKRLALLMLRLLGPVLPTKQLKAFLGYFGFLRNWVEYINAGGQARFLDLYPCLIDNTSTIRVDVHYFYQAVWAYKRILQNGSKRHVDVGSDIKFVGMLTAALDVTFIDIRPPNIMLERFTVKEASILSLPYQDNSVSSLSCLHVLEHIGLGRYGDPIDPRGSEKACRELCRILAQGGRLYLSTPIGRPRVQFNGQRVFHVKEILSMLAGLKLMELSVIDAKGNYQECVDLEKVDLDERSGGSDFGLGMYVFEKG
jgi:SAM-dependent methyltransferase